MVARQIFGYSQNNPDSVREKAKGSCKEASQQVKLVSEKEEANDQTKARCYDGKKQLMLSFIQSVNRSFHIRVSEVGAMMMRSCKPFSAGSWGSFLCPSLWGPKAADGRVVHSRVVRGQRAQVGGGGGGYGCLFKGVE